MVTSSRHIMYALPSWVIPFIYSIDKYLSLDCAKALSRWFSTSDWKN